MVTRGVCRFAVLLALAVLASASPASAQCTPEWAQGLFPRQGTPRPASALCVYDDGRGPALYAAIPVPAPGPTTSYIGRWDGYGWQTAGSINGSVEQILVFDDGTGPALYVCGDFTSVEGVTANTIARWNGESWSAFGVGTCREITAMCVFDDGSGPALTAAGSFRNPDQTLRYDVSRWDGQAWQPIGAGLGCEYPWISILCPFDDGTGPTLCASGIFMSADGTGPRMVKRWDGTSWVPLGSPFDTSVYALCVYDDGRGPALYLGGRGHLGCMRWNGQTWQTVGLGVDYDVWSMCVYDDGSGPALYAGGCFRTAGGIPAPGLAKWDGTLWHAIDWPQLDAWALCVFNDGSGPALFAAGSSNYTDVDIQKWNGKHWSTLGGGLDSSVYAICRGRDAEGDALYVGGRVSIADDVAIAHIGRFDGRTWKPLGTGVDGSVRAVCPIGSGRDLQLYAGGAFRSAGAVPLGNVAQWDGGHWQSMGGGTNGEVKALCVRQTTIGHVLYAGGAFTKAGGLTAAHVAQWDGASWSALGPGLPGTVEALCVFDSGSGPEPYAGYSYTDGSGKTAGQVSRWDGSAWQPVGPAMDYSVYVLAVLNDGSGGALYAGGGFYTIGGAVVNHIARWSGSSWEPVGGGVSGSVRSLTVHDDGTGPAIYAAGRIFGTNGAPVNVAKRNGSTWQPLGSGTDKDVYAICSFDDPGGRALYAGGDFLTAGGHISAYLARWGCESSASSIPASKSAGDNRRAELSGLSNLVSTATFGDFLYVEERNRTSGIKVYRPGHGVSVGARVSVSGRVRTGPDGERYIDAWSVAPGGPVRLDPLGMTLRSLGGGTFGLQEGVWGWQLFENPDGTTERKWMPLTGLNNMGLLVRVWGRYHYVGPGEFTLDDGWTTVRCAAPPGVALSRDWTYAGVTGISSCKRVGGEMRPLLRVRSSGDIDAY